MASPPLVSWMNPLPMELAPALAARRKAVAAKATGRVLDLGGWSDHLGGYRLGGEVSEVMLMVGRGDQFGGHSRRDQDGISRVDAGLETLVELRAGPFDTIVSLIRTPLVSDFDRFVSTVDRLLAPDGHLMLLEPVSRQGRLGLMLKLSGSLVRATGGLRLDRDIPARLRESGFAVTDLDRFEVPTVSAPLRPFIEATARRFSSARS